MRDRWEQGPPRSPHRVSSAAAVSITMNIEQSYSSQENAAQALGRGKAMSAYIIGDVAVTDPAGYEEYRAQVLDTLAPYQGRFLVRGGAFAVLEGDWPSQRLVVLEFPSAEQARAWYGSPAYQRILPIRQRHARSKLLLVEGVPQAL
jgi:uncharacterized protein (DUF1330 family)